MTRLFSARISPFIRSRKSRNSASASDSAAAGAASPEGSAGGASSVGWRSCTVGSCISELPGAEGQEGVLECLALVGALGALEQALVARDGEDERVGVVLGAGEARRV